MTELGEAIEEVLDDEFRLYETGELRVQDNLIREVLDVDRTAVLPNIIRNLRTDHQRLLEFYLGTVIPQPVKDSGTAGIFIELAMATQPRSMEDARKALEAVVNNLEYRPLFERFIEPDSPPQRWWEKLFR
jgi:hypothetical protein